MQVDGTCEVLDASEGEEALDAFVAYFRSIAGEHSDWEEYRQAMVDQGKSLLRITHPLGHRAPPAASRRRSLHARHPVSARMSR